MEKSSFFSSVNGDRRYKAEDWANYFNKFITNGYFPNVGSNLQVIADRNRMQITLKPGSAWINGYMYQNTEDLVLNVDTADGVVKRIDRVVLRCDFVERRIRAYIKKGVFAANPVAPTLQRDADAHELAVAEILVRNGVVVINQEDVTDIRLNIQTCGVVNSLIQVDTTTIFNQYLDWLTRTKQKHEQDTQNIINQFTTFTEAEKQRYKNDFTTWFNNLKIVLDGNVAGNLMNEITKTNVRCDNISQKLDESLEPLNVSRLGKDNNGIFTTVEWRTKNNMLRKRAVLSDPDSDLNYRSQSVTNFGKDGTTVISTEVYKRIFDDEGDLISEVVQ
ncbi:hypothetical protein [Bacillus cereus]|uniref:hypothetical protein n=1 Tax=Bacillus cereus TaxID=1396 RepID=UPI0038001A99